MPKPSFDNNSQIAEIIRVNHAGEYGAKRIYEGQLAFIKNSQDKALIYSMMQQEEVHLDYFSKELVTRKIRPTALIGLWNISGYVLGALSAFCGRESAMLVTQSVEEVIEKHYQQQLGVLKKYDNEKILAKNIEQFLEDEIEHKNTAINNESNQVFLAPFFQAIIKRVCITAIYLSKKI
jgi:3-demethoxyubiquinol 3-hydroxylase